MQEIIIKIGVTMVMKLLTETFVSRGMIRIARSLATKTTNQLDDGMVDDIADALGHKDLKK